MGFKYREFVLDSSDTEAGLLEQVSLRFFSKDGVIFQPVDDKLFRVLWDGVRQIDLIVRKRKSGYDFIQKLPIYK